LLKTQQFIFGTGTAIWWLTEPHYDTELVTTVKSFVAQASECGYKQDKSDTRIALGKIAKQLTCSARAKTLQK
jgi:hypothetical protein